MPAPTITSLPTPPSTSDPTNFATRADAFLAALPTFVTEANALAAYYGSTGLSNAATLGGKTWASPDPIGTGTPVDVHAAAFSASGNTSLSGIGTGAKLDIGGSGVAIISAARGGSSGANNLLITDGNGSSVKYGVVGCAASADVWGLGYTASAGSLLTAALMWNGSGHILAGTDNTQTMGGASNRWSVVYAGTGTINTSDAQDKTSVSPLTEAEVSAAIALSRELGTFRFLDAVAAKGDAARYHVGMTVQRAVEVMQSFGLDPLRYGFICYDEWDDEYRDEQAADGELSRQVTRHVTSPTTRKEIQIVGGIPTLVSATVDEPQFDSVTVVDEAGAPVVVNGRAVMHAVPVMETVEERYNRVLVRAAGSRYGFRTDELLLFIVRGIDARLTSAGL